MASREFEDGSTIQTKLQRPILTRLPHLLLTFLKSFFLVLVLRTQIHLGLRSRRIRSQGNTELPLRKTSTASGGTTGNIVIGTTWMLCVQLLQIPRCPGQRGRHTIALPLRFIRDQGTPLTTASPIRKKPLPVLNTFTSNLLILPETVLRACKPQFVYPCPGHCPVPCLSLCLRRSMFMARKSMPKSC